MSYAHTSVGTGGFELPRDGIEIPVLAHGHEIGRFVLVPTPGVGTSIEERVVAVAIADQVAGVWSSETPQREKESSP